MSYVSTLIGNLAVLAKRTQARRLLAAAVEPLEGRQLLSAVAISSPSVNEGGNLVYNVTLNTPSAKAVTVNYAATRGTAVLNRDYKPFKAGKLTFAPGETTKTITVKTKVNKLYTTTKKTVTLHLTAPSAGNSIKGNGIGTGTIINTDAAPVITIANAATTEGQAGTKILTFKVKMTGAAAETPVKVNYATANVSTLSSGKNADYVTAKGLLTFTKLNQTQIIKVAIRGDKTAEADEAFLVKLTGKGFTVVNPLVDGANFAVGSIKNDDGGSVSANTTVTAAPPVVSVNPGTAAGVTLSLNHISADPVTVFYNTANGTASAGADYTAISSSVTFNPGETSKTVTVATSSTSTGGTFDLNLASATNANPANSGAIVTITAAPLPSLSVSDATIVEGNAGTKNAVVTVSLSAPTNQTITVGYATANGTASAGSDYTATAGTLTFTPGQTAKTISIPIIGDTAQESDETFTLNLGAPVNAPITKTFGTVTITNDDGGSVVDPNDNTGLTFDNTTGHGFTISQVVTDFHYGIASTRTAARANLQLEFVVLPAGGNVNTVTAYKTVSLGTINAGQTLTGDIDLSGSPTIALGSGARYATRLVSNGVIFAVFQSIAF